MKFTNTDVLERVDLNALSSEEYLELLEKHPLAYAVERLQLKAYWFFINLPWVMEISDFIFEMKYRFWKWWSIR